MKRSVHEVMTQRALRTGGAQHYRREGEQRRESDVEQEEIDAAREWLRHVEAGRIG